MIKKNHFISRMGDKLKSYRLSGATFYDCIITIYQFIKSFLDNKLSKLEEYEAFKIAVLAGGHLALSQVNILANLFSKLYVTFILQWIAFIFGRDEEEDQ